jgi:glucose-6-phosphate isomerase
MIQFETQWVTPKAVGTDQGLDLNALWHTEAKLMAEALEDLYGQKDTAGAWKRWLNLAHDKALFSSIATYAQQQAGKFDDLVVLGIGGSSLGGYALLRALKHPYWNNLSREQRGGLPRYHFIENVDPDQIAGLLDTLDLRKTLVNVISKSGTTAETMSAFLLFQEKLEALLGKDAAKNHIVATTDKAKGILRQMATDQGYATFEVPDDVGGRFSIFSAVGLLPAALCGVDITAMQQGLADMDAVVSQRDLTQNPAAQNALIQYWMYRRGKTISVFMPYSYRLASVADWYVQIWGESLGKKFDRDGRIVNVGPTPLRAVGVTDQHSLIQLLNEGPFDKIITFVQVATPDNPLSIPQCEQSIPPLAHLGGKGFHELLTAEFQATRAALAKNQRPSVTITLPQLDAYHFAQLLYLLEVQTALTGYLFGIDPFDQPGVEMAKKYTDMLMGKEIKDLEPILI